MWGWRGQAAAAAAAAAAAEGREGLRRTSARRPLAFFSGVAYDLLLTTYHQLLTTDLGQQALGLLLGGRLLRELEGVEEVEGHLV